MKRILLTIVAIAAITLSAVAQGLQDIQSTSWYGGPGKSYVDRATLDSRAENYHFIINESNSDIHLCIRKDGRKAWYSFNGGVHFMGYYEESITNSEKKILDKENPGWNNRDNGSSSTYSSKKNKKKHKK
ncbi:MAG: hypothetical protein SPK85_00095 [Prevotella sp.]|nr:hypothetical protein [Prevotella sp.]